MPGAFGALPQRRLVFWHIDMMRLATYALESGYQKICGSLLKRFFARF